MARDRGLQLSAESAFPTTPKVHATGLQTMKPDHGRGFPPVVHNSLHGLGAAGSHLPFALESFKSPYLDTDGSATLYGLRAALYTAQTDTVMLIELYF